MHTDVCLTAFERCYSEVYRTTDVDAMIESGLVDSKGGTPYDPIFTKLQEVTHFATFPGLGAAGRELEQQDRH